MTHYYWPIVFLLLPLMSYASDFNPKGPLTFRNQNPIYLEFLNLTPARAVTLPKGEISLRMDNTYSNIFEQGFGNNTAVLLDTELLRTAFHLDAGIYEKMEVGIEVPFLHFQRGFLDSFLQNYHNAFGFPNAGRETVANDGFAYILTEGGATVYNVPMTSYGLGDITLDFKHNFLDEGDRSPAAAWLFYLKLPTGNRQNGMGSGNPDFGFGAAMEKSYERWHGYFNLAYFVNGGHAAIQKYMNDIYFSYVTGGEFSISKPVSIVAQLNGGTPLLKGTGMIQWDWPPMDLQAGLKGSHPLQKGEGPSLEWQLGFSEDLIADGPSIDITTFGSIGVRFGI